MEICDQLELKENQESTCRGNCVAAELKGLRERAPLGEITHLFTKRPSKKIRVSQDIGTNKLVMLR